MLFNCKTIHLIHIMLLLLLVTSSLIFIVNYQNLKQEKAIKTIVSQVESYDNAIGNFKQQYGSHPADFKEAKDYWENASKFPTLPQKIKDNKGLIRSLKIWQRLALSNNAPGTYSNDAIGKNLIIPSKSPVYLDEIVPDKKYLLNLYGQDELITPFQMNKNMALMLQGKYSPEQRIKDIRNQKKSDE